MSKEIKYVKVIRKYKHKQSGKVYNREYFVNAEYRKPTKLDVKKYKKLKTAYKYWIRKNVKLLDLENLKTIYEQMSKMLEEYEKSVSNNKTITIQ